MWQSSSTYLRFYIDQSGKVVRPKAVKMGALDKSADFLENLPSKSFFTKFPVPDFGFLALASADLVDRLGVLFVDHRALDLERRGHFALVDRELAGQEIDPFYTLVV